MTTPRADWHADEPALRGLLDGTIGPVFAASVESHLMRCDPCRNLLNAMAYDETLEVTWSAIRTTVEAPELTWLERVMRRCGQSEETGRLLVAVPAMRGAWLLGVAGAMIFAGLAAGFSGYLGIGLFLLIAPLAPVAGVAAAFGGDADPAQEMVVTTPYSSVRLLLLRTAAVLATCAPIAMLVGLALPGPDWLTIAWLTPAAAGTTVTLALAPRFGFTNAAVAVGAVWSALIVAMTQAHHPMLLVGSLGQLICIALAAVAGALVVSQSWIFDLPRRQP